MYNALTDVDGIRVGHWTNLEVATGCTVVLCPDGAVAGVDVRGGAPGTREIAMLNPVCKIQRVHAIVISGGSAFGLAAADGVMRWLEERGHGFEVGGVVRVPIVPAAILFDLGIGRADVRPDAAAGYAACEAATDGAVEQGCVGAGTGATAGKMLGFAQATKSGLGSASIKLSNGLIVAALVAPNPIGDIYDPLKQTTIAGTRNLEGQFTDSVQLMINRATQNTPIPTAGTNTTLAVIATNAKLSKTQITKVAQMAQDGLARTIRPIHTNFDGDTIFALSCGQEEADVSLIGTLAANVLAQAVVSAALSATGLHGVPAAGEL